jgi:hypothetical protein
LLLGGSTKAKELLEELWRKIALRSSFVFKPGKFDKEMASSTGSSFSSKRLRTPG